MKKISDEDYHEYTFLKTQRSLASIERLEDDIDYPIRNCVAMLALSGCSPLFSCCGFDYAGQPFHKAHQYGEPYIMLDTDEQTSRIIGTIFSRLPYGWKVERRGRVIYLELLHINNPHWDSPDKIHFSENIVIKINELEHFLYKNLSDVFLTSVTLGDTNQNHIKNLKYWQYIPKEPWVITLDSLNI